MYKKFLLMLSKTPMHPQWLVFRAEAKMRARFATLAKGRVLDIGCANQFFKSQLSDECFYTGLDYPKTVSLMYGTRPMVFGDARVLPVKSTYMDTIVLMEVLEHVSEPDVVIEEVFRVLKQDGLFLFSMPFLYPIHDSPFDFLRLTIHGLHQMMALHSFEIVDEQAIGGALTTASLLLNLAMAKTVLNGIKKRNPILFLGVVLPFLIPLVNVSAWLLGKIIVEDDFMPISYMLVLRKTKQ